MTNSSANIDRQNESPPREELPVDVLIVGSGISALSTAYHLKQSMTKHNEAIDNKTIEGEKIDDVDIIIIEKCADVGSAVLSGAVMDPIALQEMMPDFKEQGAPLEATVKKDAVYHLSEKGSFRLPITPPPFKNHGNYIVSLSKFVRWFKEKVEATGVEIFTSFPGSSILYEGNKVLGVQTGDRGIDKDGNRRAGFEPGVDIKAKVTILAEGTRGNLTKELKKKLGLDEHCNPEAYGTGVKEVWQINERHALEGHVLHTMGYPCAGSTMGGGWLYGMQDNMISLGWVTWLSNEDPFNDPHKDFQMFKQHPFIRKFLEDGKMIQYGAKTIPEGGLYTVPQLYADGVMLVGDAANLVNTQRLKGIHLSMKSGMLAAETILDAVQKNDFSSSTLQQYEEAYKKSWMYKELYSSRNFHQAFEGSKLWGMIQAGVQSIFGGWSFGTKLHGTSDHARMKTVKEYYGSSDKKPEKIAFDKKLTFSKLDDVFHSGTMHEENQPVHLLVDDLDICRTRCVEEYQNPCERFCPANVYEMEGEGESIDLKINASNCVHCKTCDIKDPYGIITWVPPEGGGGPKYTIL